MKKISVLFLIIGFLFSCNLFRNKKEKHVHVNKNKPDNKTVIYRKTIKLDSNYLIIKNNHIDEMDSESKKAKDKLSNISNIDSIFGSIKFQSFKDELVNENKVVIRKMIHNTQELKELEVSFEKMRKIYQADSVRAFKKKVINEEYAKYRNKHPNREIDSNVRNQITINSSKIIKKFYEQKELDLLGIRKKVTNLIVERETIAVEVLLLESSALFSDVLWDINNESHFDVSSANLAYEDSMKRVQAYGKFFDLVFKRIEDIYMAVFSNDKNFQQKFAFKIFVDGYSDSQTYTKDSFNKNMLLSEKRAKMIYEIFINIYEEKKENVSNSNLIFEQPIEVIQGHGTKKPDIVAKFEDEGGDDINRRLVMIHCRIIPIQ